MLTSFCSAAHPADISILTVEVIEPYETNLPRCLVLGIQQHFRAQHGTGEDPFFDR